MFCYYAYFFGASCFLAVFQGQYFIGMIRSSLLTKYMLEMPVLHFSRAMALFWINRFHGMALEFEDV